MGNVDYTATGLVTALLRKALLPNIQETLGTQDYFALMNEELLTYIVPLLMKTREEYLVTQLAPDLSYTTATDTYPLPYRAIGGKLRLIQINMGGQPNTTFVPLPRIEPERAYNYATQGTVDGYDLMGNNIVLVPFPSVAGVIRIKYFLRPGQVVDSSAAAQITGINTGTNTVTCGGGLPATYTSGILYDFIKGNPGFDTWAFDQTGTVSGNTIQFSSLPTNLAVGDWVALAGQSPIPQCPYELFPLLSQATVCAALEALGEAGKPHLAQAEAKRDRLETKLLTLLQPRTEGSARTIINFYGPGFARIGRFRRR